MIRGGESGLCYGPVEAGPTGIRGVATSDGISSGAPIPKRAPRSGPRRGAGCGRDRSPRDAPERDRGSGASRSPRRRCPKPRPCRPIRKPAGAASPAPRRASRTPVPGRPPRPGCCPRRADGPLPRPRRAGHRSRARAGWSRRIHPRPPASEPLRPLPRARSRPLGARRRAPRHPRHRGRPGSRSREPGSASPRG